MIRKFLGSVPYLATLASDAGVELSYCGTFSRG